MRRSTLVFCLLFVGLLGAPAAIAAQDATPSPAAYPELTITATDTGFSAPAQVAAGRYLVTFVNTGAQGNGMFLWRLPAGLTAADLQTALPERAPGSTGAAPDSFYQADLPGAPGYAEAGRQTQAVVDLAPGNYAILTEEGAWATPLEVLPDESGTPVALPDPTADLDLTLQEFAFASLPTVLAPGRHVWKIANAGDQPHQVIVSKVPDGTTFAQVLAGFPHSAEATPVPDALPRSAFDVIGGLEIISPGHTAWALLDLEPGTYAVVCLVPDRASGLLHAANGMVAVLTVKG